MNVAHEALAKELSCPVCLELYTPPVLELPCGHNYCKQCIEATLFSQNCTHVNGHFFCPMCRKLTYLRGKGIGILKRNIFAENVLDKFKQELEIICNKELSQKTQMCDKHEEELMNLMCLHDDMPICSICKLFGDHKSHNVAKLSDVYQQRKKCFTEDMKSLHMRSENASGTIQEIEKLITDIVSACKDTKTMIDAVGASLLTELKSKINMLKMKVESERVQKIEKLQEILAALHGPTQLYLQMKRLLDSHLNPVHFLKEDKQLRGEVARFSQQEALPQIPKEGSISVSHYFKELVKGIDMKDFVSSETNNLLLKSAEEHDAWMSSCSNLNVPSAEALDEIIHKIILSLGFKSKEADTSYDEYESFLSTSTTSNCLDPAQEMEVLPLDGIDV
ncbi:tripartite motif-containing protein 54-like [Hemiscyllium ocellatum]|uniref:tripartite motif-containing protein 54-like n=1 Tax=Hemiscyllium ocellatum TaxID=170820 RepID=UPI0029670412|nr:tripartite motif-containing protein 54-like [Hemiscyllium ocellatum]